MRKKVLAFLCVTMMGALCACGEKDVSAVEEQSPEIEQEASGSKDESVEKSENSEKVETVQEGTIIVEGMELSFPITRTELNKWFEDNGIIVFDESRYQIHCSVTNESDNYMYARFLSGDPEVCTSIYLNDCDVSFSNLINKTVDMGSISEKVAESDAFDVIAQGTENFDYVDYKVGNTDHDYIAFASKESGTVYEIDSYNAEFYSFAVYLDEKAYGTDGNVSGTIVQYAGDYLSSTGLSGLYVITSGAGLQRHPVFYEYGGDEQHEISNARITDWISGGGSEYAPNGQYSWTYGDKFCVGTDDNNAVVEVFDKTAQGQWVSLDYKSDSEVGGAFSAPAEVSAKPENNTEEEVKTADVEGDASNVNDIDISSLPETYGFYEYIGGTITSIGTDLIVFDKSGKAVAVYKDHYELNIKDIPICDGSDPSSFPPHVSEGDGLDYSCGYDENGNIVFIY